MSAAVQKVEEQQSESCSESGPQILVSLLAEEGENASAPDGLSLGELVDALYDLLAAGVQPAPGLTLAALEAFLHEHAREPKGRQAVVAFFHQHGLTIPQPVELVPQTAVRALSPLPPLPTRAPAALAETEVLAPEEPAAAEQIDQDEAPTVRAVVAHPARRPLKWVAMGLGGLLLALLFVGLVQLSQLRSEVERVESLSEVNREALSDEQRRVRNLTVLLQEHQVHLIRLEQQNDMLLDNLLPAPVERVEP